MNKEVAEKITVEKIAVFIDHLLLTDGPRSGLLDGVRSVAIAAVIFRHTWDLLIYPRLNLFPGGFPAWIALPMRFGWSGVMLFFAAALAAIVSFLLIERPFLLLKRRLC